VQCTPNLLRGRIMKTNSQIIRNLLFSFLSLATTTAFSAAPSSAQSTPQSAAAVPQASPVPARITQAIDDTQLFTLKGNVHPLAQARFDQGAVSDATPMQRMMLVLQRSPEQETALQQLMNEQLSKDSPSFHQWLTPQQFGQQFGPSDTDIQTITTWLTQQGFQQIKVGAGRLAIEFSGNAGQVRDAFHTEIHHFLVNGKMRQANVSNPQVPAALAPVVAGVLTLHNFPRKSYKVDSGTHIGTHNNQGLPQFTTTSGCGTGQAEPCYVLGPADFAKVYNIPSSLTGANEQIGIVADSNINPQDVTDFRNLFGLPSNPPNIILNGPDPGFNGDEGEADLDVQVSGMVAPNATIDFVVSEDTLTAAGIDLSAFYIIDNNIAPVMSESFGDCEFALGSSGNTFYNELWEQAAAQGITVAISAGDNSSAGCDNFDTASEAENGLDISGIASTPYNVAVGGTDFDDVGTQSNFWSSTNASGSLESALGYIHETTWNDSCAATATSANLNTICASPNGIVGGSGGPSGINAVTFAGYAKPPWQSGIIPNGVAAGDNHRYIPDVSLFASEGLHSLSFYLVCEADSVPPDNPPSCASSGPFSFEGVGGTSASSPAFAAIMALINQNNGRQGNANPTLYKIAATSGQSCNSSTENLTGSACAFNDVTKGNNAVPCAGGSLNCSSTTSATGVLVSTGSATTPAWTTATGYDLATGLGSLNVANLNTQWPLAAGTFHGTTTALTINGGTSTVTITHGTSVAAKVTVTSTSGTPTGDVALLAPTSVNGGIGSGTLASGSTTINTTFLPGGSYTLNARYAGDDTFASSITSTGVPVVVNKENSRLQYGIVTFDPLSGAITSTNATSITYGSPYILRIDILNNTTSACQAVAVANGGTGTTAGCAVDATGTVTINDSINGAAPVPLDTGTFVINSAGHAEDQPIQLTGGSHALAATYTGDISYNPVTTPVTDTINVSQALTQLLSVGASPSSGVSTNTAVTLTATIATGSNGAGPTGTVTFTAGSTTLGTANVVGVAASSTAASGTATLTHTFATPGTFIISATYSGDTNYSASGPTTGPSISVVQATVGNFMMAAGPVTVATTAATAGTSSGTSAITITPSGGFSTAVTVTCGTIPGVNCSALTIPSGTLTGSLTINVNNPSSSMTAMVAPDTENQWAANRPERGGRAGWWSLSAGTGFAAVLLLFLPNKKRYRAALGLGLACILSFTLGCGGGSSGGGGGGGGGTTPTVTQLTVSSTKVADLPSATLTVSATVTGGTPTGTVQFMVDGVALGGPATLTSGSTGNITVTAAQAPAFLQLVGTHTVSANYSGGTTTAASHSGTLNVTITGTTSLPVTGTAGTDTANANVSLTIN
jgi:hypothetical protein